MRYKQIDQSPKTFAVIMDTLLRRKAPFAPLK